MRKSPILGAIVILYFAVVALAQTHSFAALDTTNAWTGTNTFAGPTTLPLPHTLSNGGFNNSLAGSVTAARTWMLQDASERAKALKTAEPIKQEQSEQEQIELPEQLAIGRERKPQSIMEARNRPTREPMCIGESLGNWRRYN